MVFEPYKNSIASGQPMPMMVSPDQQWWKTAVKYHSGDTSIPPYQPKYPGSTGPYQDYQLEKRIAQGPAMPNFKVMFERASQQHGANLNLEQILAQAAQQETNDRIQIARMQQQSMEQGRVMNRNYGPAIARGLLGF